MKWDTLLLLVVVIGISAIDAAKIETLQGQVKGLRERVEKLEEEPPPSSIKRGEPSVDPSKPRLVPVRPTPNDPRSSPRYEHQGERLWGH